MKKLMGIMLSVILLVGAASCAAALDGITVVSREDGSGTRGAFIELFKVEVKNDAGEKIDQTYEEALIASTTGVMLSTVAGNPNSIGYVSLGSLSDTVKSVKIDGVAATVEGVKSGEYKVARPFNIATVGELKALAQDFVNFILSENGQQVVEANHYVRASEAPAYSGTPTSGSIVVAGSSSVTPLMEKLKEAYLLVNPEAVIDIQMSDSTTGINAALDGIADIGMASRALKDSELEKGAAPTVIAMDGLAVIVNKENAIENLSAETVRQIFTGEVTDWNAIG
ncbi:MAG: substrate-binding domain-containing protein [Christensenellaceae bacterium]|nr:substrate-binding domain-containing protein [Christensenellaceae bacterium]MEA5065526.1 substrate-binding domain-containing protein [Eubacteriales bacterium]MEA5068096.1 substrate-binding domain-containing protein [Christensenellaceae bacterium]